MIKEIQNIQMAKRQKDAYLKFIFKSTTKHVDFKALQQFYIRRHEIDQKAIEYGCEGMNNITDDSYHILNMTFTDYQNNGTLYTRARKRAPRMSLEALKLPRKKEHKIYKSHLILKKE
jgi:hypothetical protein